MRTGPARKRGLAAFAGRRGGSFLSGHASEDKLNLVDAREALAPNGRQFELWHGGGNPPRERPEDGPLNRPELTRPGRLQHWTTVDKVLAGQRYARNAIIVDVMRDHGRGNPAKTTSTLCL